VFISDVIGVILRNNLAPYKIQQYTV